MRQPGLKLYIFLFGLCILGYGWVYWNMHSVGTPSQSGVCIVKNVSGIPCPSCGSTRSATRLVEGAPLEAFFINPMGIIVVILMVVIPPWLMVDMVRRRFSFWQAYQKTERLLRKPGIAIFCIVALLMNWVWNIIKEL